MAHLIKSGTVIKVIGPQGEFDARIVGVAVGADLQNSGATVVRAQPLGTNTLPAGSTVTAFVVTGGNEGGGVSVPSSAIQTVDGATVVFVKTTTGFRAHSVLVGTAAAGQTQILRGLSGTELVASTNAFLLKAEMARGEAEHGH